MPGALTVALVPLVPTLMCPSRPPTEVDTPRLPMFNRTPGAMRMLRRKRKGIVSRSWHPLLPLAHTDAVNVAAPVCEQSVAVQVDPSEHRVAVCRRQAAGD